MQMLANKTTSSSSTITQPRNRLPTDDDYMTEHSDESGLIPIWWVLPQLRIARLVKKKQNTNNDHKSQKLADKHT